MHRSSFTLAEARAIALRSQALADDPAPFGSGKTAVLKAVQHLGYVQVDTISVIQRAHHHILWSRIPDYEPSWLHELQSPDVSVFEYWNHATSYLPTRDYRYSLLLMRRHGNLLHWSDDSKELREAMRRLMAQIRKKGPLMISEVKANKMVKAWSEKTLGKIERLALHELWMRGEVMIRSRKGMEKVFDLPGRVLPKGTDISVPSLAETVEFHVRRTLAALGIARLQELNYSQEPAQMSGIRAAVEALMERGEVIEAHLEEFPKVTMYALRDAFKLAAPLGKKLVRFLSPFDNAVIQRKRLKWLFDFEYVAEIYVPAAKRKYGYFALPILWGDRLIGRIDCKANRPDRELVVNSLIFEPTFKEFKAVKTALVDALRDFTRFQQCEKWKVVRIDPKSFRVN
ncbi:MAG TPA: crosslink repair DNA glycosylase YcaQ family protein [Candidatus Methylacidiphilales bacterium]